MILAAINTIAFITARIIAYLITILFVSLYFSLVWTHSCESKLHSGNNMILTSLIRNSDCCQCKYIEWRSCRRSAHDQTGCWPARSEATCIHSGYADCSLQSRQFMRGREGYILTILRWQLLLLMFFFTGFADASVAPIDFPIAPAAAMPKVQ